MPAPKVSARTYFKQLAKERFDNFNRLRVHLKTKVPATQGIY